MKVGVCSRGLVLVEVCSGGAGAVWGPAGGWVGTGCWSGECCCQAKVDGGLEDEARWCGGLEPEMGPADGGGG